MKNQEDNGLKRIAAFDLFRIVLTFFVVNLHREALSPHSATIFSTAGWYAVPLFILLSFFLTSKYFLVERASVSSLYVRIRRFIIPFFLWSFIGFIVNPQEISSRNIIFQLATGGVVDVPLYYLLVMAILTTFFWLCTYIPTRIRIMFFGILVCAAFYLQYSKTNFGFFDPLDDAVVYCYGRLAELIPYALLGLLLGYVVIKIQEKKFFLFLSGLSGVLFFAYYRAPQPWGFDYSGVKYFVGSLFIFSSVLLTKPWILPRKAERIITILGSYSLGVYVSHYLLLQLFFTFIPLSQQMSSMYPYLFLVVFFPLCYGVCVGLNRLTGHRLSVVLK